MAARCIDSAIVGAVLQAAFEELGISPNTTNPVYELQKLTESARVEQGTRNDRVIHNVSDERHHLGGWYNSVRHDLGKYLGEELPFIAAHMVYHTDVPNMRKAMVVLKERLGMIPSFAARETLDIDTQEFVTNDLEKNFKNFGHSPNYVYLLNDEVAGYIYLGTTAFGSTMVFTSKSREMDVTTEYYIHQFINRKIQDWRKAKTEEA